MNFELLDAKRHDRKGFDCGVSALNVYLQQVANQLVRRNRRQPYCAVWWLQDIRRNTLRDCESIIKNH